MNFNFFVNTQMPTSTVPGERLAALEAIEGLGAEVMAPLPVEQLEAMKAATEPGPSLGGGTMAPMSEETLLSLEMDAGPTMQAMAPLPVEQLEAMIGGESHGVLGVGEVELAPMSEEALSALGAGGVMGTQVDTPMSVGELEAMTAGVGGEALPGLHPLSEEDLALLDEVGPPPAPEAIEVNEETKSGPRPRAKSRAKSKAGT